MRKERGGVGAMESLAPGMSRRGALYASSSMAVLRHKVQPASEEFDPDVYLGLVHGVRFCLHRQASNTFQLQSNFFALAAVQRCWTTRCNRPAKGLTPVSTSGLISGCNVCSHKHDSDILREKEKPHAPAAAPQYCATWRSWLARFPSQTSASAFTGHERTAHLLWAHNAWDTVAQSIGYGHIVYGML